MAESYKIKKTEASLWEKKNKVELLKYEEVCHLLKISKSTLWRMMKSGKINPIEIMPGIKRFRLEDLQRLVEKGGSHDNR